MWRRASSAASATKASRAMSSCLRCCARVRRRMEELKRAFRQPRLRARLYRRVPLEIDEGETDRAPAERPLRADCQRQRGRIMSPAVTFLAALFERSRRRCSSPRWRTIGRRRRAFRHGRSSRARWRRPRTSSRRGTGPSGALFLRRDVAAGDHATRQGEPARARLPALRPRLQGDVDARAWRRSRRRSRARGRCRRCPRSRCSPGTACISIGDCGKALPATPENIARVELALRKIADVFAGDLRSASARG